MAQGLGDARAAYPVGDELDGKAARDAWANALGAVLNHVGSFGLGVEALPLLDLYGALADLEHGNVHPGLSPDTPSNRPPRPLWKSRPEAEACAALNALVFDGVKPLAAARQVVSEMRKAGLGEWKAQRLVDLRKKLNGSGSDYPNTRKLYEATNQFLCYIPKEQRAEVAISILISRRRVQ